MKKLIRRLLNQKNRNEIEGNRSKHQSNIMSGPKMIIDGKTFVKVKLRFVDSLDFKTGQYIDNLETEIYSQKLEIEKLTSLAEENEKKINDLQNLNINLLYENRTNSKKIKDEISELRIENQKHQNRSSSHENDCKKMKKKIIELNSQLIKSNSKAATNENKIRSLEQTIKWLKSSESSIVPTLNKIARLKSDLQNAENKLSAIKKESEQKDLLIETLTKRILDHERKLYLLETKIKE